MQKSQKGNPLWAIPLKQLSATRERPLFAPSRRPPPPVVREFPTAALPPPPPPKPSEPEKPLLTLVGTVAGDGEGIGVFVDPASRTVLRLKTGESHNGWLLRSVQRREVILEKGHDTSVLVLPAPDMKKASAAQLGNRPVFGANPLDALRPVTARTRDSNPPMSAEDAPDSPADAASGLAVRFNPYQPSIQQ
jgi:general secretion pathway protein N